MSQQELQEVIRTERANVDVKYLLIPIDTLCRRRGKCWCLSMAVMNVSNNLVIHLSHTESVAKRNSCSFILTFHENMHTFNFDVWLSLQKQEIYLV